MNIVSLQSGSNGNSIFVEAGGVRLLFDAGISGRQAQQRLASAGWDIQDVNALLISHDHRDHARCMGIYQRKFALPVYTTLRTLDAAQHKDDLGKMHDIRFFQAGETIQLAEVSVETIPTPHDGADGVAFVIDDGRCRLGILTDLGHVFDELETVIRSLDGVIIESNFDPQKLENGTYPYFLKQRIRGLGGHLSNVESARLLRDATNGRLKWACLAHLSEENNDPRLAMQTHQELLGDRVRLYLASRYHPSEVMEL